MACSRSGVELWGRGSSAAFTGIRRCAARSARRPPRGPARPLSRLLRPAVASRSVRVIAGSRTARRERCTRSKATRRHPARRGRLGLSAHERSQFKGAGRLDVRDAEGKRQRLLQQRQCRLRAELRADVAATYSGHILRSRAERALRLRPRPDGRCSERDRTPSGSRFPLPLGLDLPKSWKPMPPIRLFARTAVVSLAPARTPMTPGASSQTGRESFSCSSRSADSGSSEAGSWVLRREGRSGSVWLCGVAAWWFGGA